MSTDPIRSLTALVLLLLSLPISGCGRGQAIFCAEPHNGRNTSCGAATVSPGREFVYVTSSSHGGEILAFPVDRSSGALGTFASVVGPSTPSAIASAQHQFMYVSDRQNSAIDVFSIDQTNGTLTPLPGSSFLPVGPSTFSPLALVASDSALYANDLNGITGFLIGPNGALSTIVGSPYPGGFGGQATLGQSNTTPINHFLYATNVSDPEGAISVFRIVDTGSGILTPVPGNFATGEFSGPDSVVFDGAFSAPVVFVALTNASAIAAFSVDVSTGALTAVRGSPFKTGVAPAFLALSAGQNVLYAFNASNIYAYTIATDGVLTPVRGFPFSLGAAPGGVAVTSDSYLYVSLPSLNAIEGFVISTVDGALTPVQGSPFPAIGPESLAVVEIPAP